MCRAVEDGKNAYSQTQGIAPLLDQLQRYVDSTYDHSSRKAFVTSGTSGALMLALSVLVNPGDEVIVFDPWFVMYKHLTTLAGGKVVHLKNRPSSKLSSNTS